MTVTLKVVLDQLVSPVDADLADASREIARALLRTAPTGCELAAIVPAASDVAGLVERETPGAADILRLPLPRRELAAAWQLGMVAGVAGGMIHSPSLMAPLVRHDRANDHDQTVVTMWDLAAWERPDELGRAATLWQKAMFKRAVKFADAIVVPTHAAAERVCELGRLNDRVRVIAGAAPEGFAIPTDEVGRRRALGVPEGILLMSGSAAVSERLSAGFAAVAAVGTDLPVVVIDVPEGDEDDLRTLGSRAGIDADRIHALGRLDPADRAAILGAAVVFLAPCTDTVFPWRVVEALALGVPVVAAGSASHRQVIVDGGLLSDPDDPEDLGAQLAHALSSTADNQRLATLAGDRGGAFSWTSSAERVWQLHADL